MLSVNFDTSENVTHIIFNGLQVLEIKSSCPVTIQNAYLMVDMLNAKCTPDKERNTLQEEISMMQSSGIPNGYILLYYSTVALFRGFNARCENEF
jgi:hypothetical protein